MEYGEARGYWGPALLEAATFTAYLKAGHDGRVDAHGNLVVAVA